VRLRRNLRLEPSEAPENGTQNQHSLRSATLPRAINRLTQLAAARAAAAINHPNVVSIYDWGETADPGDAAASIYFLVRR
jgi:hypothetical protein